MGENKEPIKIKLTTVLILLVVIVIAIMGYFIFKLYNENQEIKNNESSKSANLENETVESNTSNTSITSLEGDFFYGLDQLEAGDDAYYSFKADGTVSLNGNYGIAGNYEINGNKLKITYTSVIDAPEDEDIEIPEPQTLTIIDENNIKLDNSIYKKLVYEEISEELDGIDRLYVTEVVKNNNNTYTLKGRICTQYTLTKAELDKAVKEGSLFIDNEIYKIGKGKDGNHEYELYSSNSKVAYYILKKDSNTYYIENTTENPNVYKSTDKFRKITVDDTVMVENTNTEEKSKIDVKFKDILTNKESEIPIIGQIVVGSCPSPNCTFKFENGKCTLIYEGYGV